MTDTQRAILHALLTFGPECWYAHGASLDPEMFDGEGREVFDAIAKLNRDGTESNVVTITDALAGEAANLAGEIATATDIAISARSVPSLVKHLKRAYTKRKAQDIGATLMETGDAELAKSALLTLDAAGSSATVDSNRALELFMADLEKRSSNGVTGLQTGLKDLDRQIIALEPSDLCILAARPGMGKTALMLNIAGRCGARVGIFSLEMSTAQLMTRMVSAYGIEHRLLRTGQLSDADWAEVTKATGRLRRNLWINDTGALEIGQLESEAYRMVKVHGAQLLCVDYLQLVVCKGAESRFAEVSEVSRRLKGLAKNLHVPVIALSQLNRAVETRATRKPVMADLRESGQIEQDADQIIFIHRPDNSEIATLIAAKVRNGEAGEVTVTWQGQFQRFVNHMRAVA